MFTDYLGYAAGFFTTVSFVPQLVQIWRSKSGKDISIWMMLLFGVGISSWFFYGIFLVNWPIIVANGVTLLLVVSVITLKIYYDRQ